jgi:hypothetical protein
MPTDRELMDDYNRRREDRLTDRVDQIFHIVTRTEVQVQDLMSANAHTRLCTLESAHKFWKSLFYYAAGAVGAAILACLQFFHP